MIGRLLIILSLFGVALTGYAEIVLPSWTTSSPRVKSVQWRSNGRPVLWPVTDLKGMNPLVLTFDMLFATESDEENMPWLRASIEHRDADWKKENLVEAEYVDGFNQYDVGYGEPSIGGITTLYRHFEIPLTTDEFRPKLSGNYVMNVYPDNDPDNILLSVPFMIEEQSARIGGGVSVVTDIDYKAQHQQLTLEVEARDIDPRLRPQELRVKVGQNNAPGSWRYLGFPTIIDNRTAKFSHKKELIFEAGNVYRRMEVIDNTVPMKHVDHIQWIHPFYHQILQTDEPWRSTPFKYDFNSNGMYLVREYNSVTPDYEADYCVVHFTLDGTELPRNSEIFIEGDFTGRALNDENRMLWDADNNQYYKSMLLKQGAYDYKYVTRPGKQTGINLVDGNFYENDNLYNVAVYYRLPGDRYDRLAATAIIPSR